MKETEIPKNDRDFVYKKIKTEEIEELLNQINDEPKTEKQVKKYILQFEKSLESNLEQRQIYKEPLKYIESEVELSENIRKLFEISSNPLFFPILFQLNSTISILSLLTHENTDIAIQCIELIFELTVEDSVDLVEETYLENFLNNLIENNVLVLLLDTASRLDRKKLDDKNAIFNIIGILDNFVAIKPLLAETIFNTPDFVSWILNNLSEKEFDSVKQYSSEILAIILHSSPLNLKKLVELGI